ncbi:NAD(P)/FAD-dependent oxidoreductase [Oscillibacter sp. MSJ-2]|uniref:NAD(P)/FAD-dependent oxidoreductase n=1 Tax=Dysosmobacter acutus TaxID=2841504 RepID=A0ABS6F7H3_9FIRM|nr:NAD(P)/FAD-dependent oxidoreductase [Dysosmobacter acutus]MBU5625330.1 NAD(P)/FAD-dependent oxidoreductase [Dysosmobacter acutus]
MFYEVAVIGAGPAGLSAAVNARLRGKSVAVVGNNPEENPLWKAPRVDNYLGLPEKSGRELIEEFTAHAERSGAQLIRGKVLNVGTDTERWYLGVGTDIIEAGAVVLAAGVARGRKFEGEERFVGAGVSYCATCDGMLYRGKRAAVLGFTADAEQEAEHLRGIGVDTLFFQRPRQCELQGEHKVESIRVDGTEYAVDGVFILRPTVAPADLIPGLETAGGFVTVDEAMATNLPGLYAAGDCTGLPLQLARAVGQGLVAGQSAAAYWDKITKSQASESK